jgi:hypothetical protein
MFWSLLEKNFNVQFLLKASIFKPSQASGLVSSLGGMKCSMEFPKK